MTVNRLLLPTVLAVSSLSWAQAPWPVERQNRYGTGTAIIGPPTSVLTSPWISNRLAPGAPVSHGPSLGEGGIGYFGNWSANKVFKFDYRTGAILSAFQADNFVVSVPAIGPGNSLVVSTDNSSAKVFGIDTSIMDYQWFQTTGYVGGSPNICPEGDTVYGTTGGFVHRKNAVTGATIWSKTGYGAVHGSCVFLRDDSAVVVPNGSSVSCLRWSDGKPIWSVNLGSSMNKAGVAPTGAIVVGSDSGTIYALDPGTGAILWTWVTLDKVSGGPAFSPDGSVVYMPSVDRRIYALRVSRWRQAMVVHNKPLV